MTDKSVQPDKDVRPVSGETAAAMKSGGESSGENYPKGGAMDRKAGGKQRHSGRLREGSHRPGQIADPNVGVRNHNAKAAPTD